MKRSDRLKKRIHRQQKDKFGWHTLQLFYSKIDIFKYLSIILITIFIFLTPTAIKKAIQINKIECTTQFGNCDEIILNKIKIFGNYKDVKSLIVNILEKDPIVDGYVVQYKIPSIIKVDLTLKNPKFSIKNQDLIYQVDNDGYVIDIVKESKLPMLGANVYLNLSDKVDDKTMFALNVFRKVASLYTIDSGFIENNELKIKSNGIMLRFPLEGDVDFLVGGLRIIFSRLNGGVNGIKMENVNEIDLRFANPVIR